MKWCSSFAYEISATVSDFINVNFPAFSYNMNSNGAVDR